MIDHAAMLLLLQRGHSKPNMDAAPDVGWMMSSALLLVAGWLSAVFCFRDLSGRPLPLLLSNFLFPFRYFFVIINISIPFSFLLQIVLCAGLHVVLSPRACCGCLFLFYSIPSSIFALVLSLSLPRRNLDPKSLQYKQALSPPPHNGTCLQLYREKTSALSCLVDSHRIVPTHAAKRFQQLGFFDLLLLQINSTARPRESRTPEPTLVHST